MFEFPEFIIMVVGRKYCVLSQKDEQATFLFILPVFMGLWPMQITNKQSTRASRQMGCRTLDTVIYQVFEVRRLIHSATTCS